MTERHSDLLSAYEEALGRGLLAASDDALRPVDAVAIARAAVAVAPSRGISWGRPALQRRLALTAVLLLLALAAVGLVVGAGSGRPQPLSLQLGHLAYEIDGDVWISDPDGRGAVLVADGVPGDWRYFSPQWSRDGGTLSLYADNGAVDNFRTFYQADGDGRGLHEVGRDESWDVPNVSPSGSRRAMYFGNSVTIVDEGDGRVDLPPPAGYLKWNYWYPVVWSPDESRVVLSACTTSDCKSESTHELFSVPLSGATPTRLTPAETSDYEGSISPDGGTVAFVTPLGEWFGYTPTIGDTLGVGLVGIDGTDRQLLPGVSYASSRFVWAPDSRSLALVSGQETSAGIRILSVDPTVPPRLLAGTESAWILHGFSPDGRWILASWLVGEDAALWRVEVDGDVRERLVGGPFDGDWQWLPANDAGASLAP